MRELVSSTFAAAWATAAPGVPLVLENEGIPSGDIQALLTIELTTSQQMTHGTRGARRTQRNGWIQVKLWSPANAGVAGAAALGDAVREILEMVSLPSPIAGDEPVTTQAANSGPSGTDGRWYMTLVRIPFWFVERM